VCFFHTPAVAFVVADYCGPERDHSQTSAYNSLKVGDLPLILTCHPL
jgi:hypothetical protein